jgi:YggT family protein
MGDAGYMTGQILRTTIDMFFNIVLLLILVRIILSWLPQFRHNQIGELVFSLTDPILGPFQRIVPPVGMIDISPMVAIITLAVLREILLFMVQALFNLQV